MKWIILLSFLSTMAQAETFKIAGSLQNFELKDGLLLKGCEKKCEALKVISSKKKINLKKLRKGQTFANSTGSDTCRLAYKAESILGVAENQDGRAFCVFKDGSLVEMNSLSSYLTEKKIVTE